MSILAFAYSLLLVRVARAACSGSFAAIHADLVGAYESSGRVVFNNHPQSIEWHLTSCSEGPYRCDFSYYNGGTTDRPMEFLVNGVTMVSSLSFLPTGGWNALSTVTRKVSLNAGSNTIKVITTGAGGSNYLNLIVTQEAACNKPNVAGYDLTACASVIAQAQWNLSCGSCSAGYEGLVTHTVCDPSFTAWSVSGCQVSTTTTQAATCNKPSVTGYDLIACASTIAIADWNPSCGSCSAGYEGAVTHTVCGPSGTAWSVSGCQTTTTEAPTTTTLARAESIGNFSITINVTKAQEFIQEPNITFVMSRFVALLLGIEQAWIHDLKVTLIPAHRLLTSVGAQSAMRGNRGRRILVITTKSGVGIDFKVIIPQDAGPNSVTATVLIERYEHASIAEAEAVIKQVVSSGLLGSDNYEVTVLFKAVLPAETTTTLGSSIAKEEDMQFLVICLASSTSLLCISLILCYTLRLRLRKHSVGDAQHFSCDDRRPNSERETFSAAWLMSPPDAISLDMKEVLCMWISDMIDAVNPLVFVCFATGQRREDDYGGGPGLFYAAAVIRALNEQSIPCYCSLHGALDDNHCHRILCTEDTSCGMLLVVETTAFYSSIRCFDQLHSALKSNYSIYRIRFEYNPERNGHWSDWQLTESRILKVKSELELRRIIPDGPIVQDAPQNLKLFVGELNSKIGRLGTASRSASSSGNGYIAESLAVVESVRSDFGTVRSEASGKSSTGEFAKSSSESGKGTPKKRRKKRDATHLSSSKSMVCLSSSKSAVSKATEGNRRITNRTVGRAIGVSFKL